MNQFLYPFAAYPDNSLCHFEPPRVIASKWVWIDLEATGLNPSNPDFGILEIAACVVDHDFRILDSLHVIVHQPERVIKNASTWCKKHFCDRANGGNDLFSLCRASCIPEEDAGKMLKSFLAKHAMEKSAPMSSKRVLLEEAQMGESSEVHRHGVYRVLLAGCSVHYDRSVLLEKFPYLSHYIAHKTVDITSLLEMTKTWRPNALLGLGPSSGTHRAIVDIRETITLARFLYQRVFLSGNV